MSRQHVRIVLDRRDVVAPPLPFSIRDATADDAGAILTCLRCAFEPYRSSYTPDAYRDTVLTPDTIGDRLASMSVLVAITPAGEIVGTIASQVKGSDEGHLRGMAVLPPWQGAGVAEHLLSAAERALRDSHCSRVTLDTTEPLRAPFASTSGTASVLRAASATSSGCPCTST